VRRKLYAFLCVIVLLSLNAGLGGSPVKAADPVPRFEKSECPFDVPKGRTVECGYLVVPENRHKLDSQTIRIAVAVFKAKTKMLITDAVIYLEGGPGGHSLETARISFSNAFAPFAAKRDFIMFDQRGVGYSEPSLDCPEVTKAAYEGMTKRMTGEERIANRLKGLQACRDRLAEEGIDLSAYNSQENAADVNDLRTVLGYKTFDLYGISYGTRLALTVMRDFPSGIRSVILDSIVPLQVDLYADIPANADRAFNVFFQGCLRNRQCNAAYPQLDKVFYGLVAKLNQKPVTISVRHPFTGRKYNLLIDGDLMIELLYHALYSSRVIVYLPKIISDASKGKYQLLQEALGGSLVQHEYVSAGMYYSVQCAEEISFDTVEKLRAADKRFPKLGKAFDVESYYHACRIWNVDSAPEIENKAVVIDKTKKIPTLLLSGEYDPITPPRYAGLVAQTLPGSWQFQFPGVGHGVSVGDACPYRVALAFFDKPTAKPEIGCMSTMSQPQFVTR
jgi:pimeloyl-ACP methyl ester carboxylesterase